MDKNHPTVTGRVMERSRVTAFEAACGELKTFGLVLERAPVYGSHNVEQSKRGGYGKRHG
jgi:hypothetical protein